MPIKDTDLVFKEANNTAMFRGGATTQMPHFVQIKLKEISG
jgi:hypothetical protein